MRSSTAPRSEVEVDGGGGGGGRSRNGGGVPLKRRSYVADLSAQ